MGDFNRNRRPSGRGSFEMFNVVCDECGEECQVPFKPSGDKPVYCSRCFEKHDPKNDRQGDRGFRSERRFDDSRGRRDFGSSRSRDEFRGPRGTQTLTKDNSEVTKQLEYINTNLVKLTSLLEGLLQKAPDKVAKKDKVEDKKVDKKKASKKN